MTHGRERVKKFTTRRIDVLWKTKPHLVKDEIRRLKEVEGRTNSDFELRTTASKNIIKNMTVEELTELKEAAADMEENGYTEEHKRRSVINVQAKDI
jgi:hypothetical protein